MRSKTKQTQGSFQYAFIMYLPESDSFMSDVGESLEIGFSKSLDCHVVNMLEIIDRGAIIQAELEGVISCSQDEDEKKEAQHIIDLLESIRSEQLKGEDAVTGLVKVFEGLSGLCIECCSLLWQGKAEELLTGQLELGKSLRRWYRANYQFEEECAESDDPEELEFPFDDVDDSPLFPKEQKDFIKVMKSLDFYGGDMAEQSKTCLMEIVK